MAAMSAFRSEVRDWLEENCPPGARGGGEVSSGGNKVPIQDADTRLWLERCAERGFTVPNWPTEYGGAGLDKDQYLTLISEMRRIGARSPLTGMGVVMIGPTLLDHGTEDQKRRHLPRIASGEIRWCQGYSEPGSGSDLASLSTRAVDKGDFFEINGQKIWTSGAQYADWIFCLTRTNPDVPKHDGISFMLFTMDQPGVSVKPIRLLSGASPFCETFFDNAVAQKEDVIGGLNKGWTVAKRLLQHERSGITRLAGSEPAADSDTDAPSKTISDIAKEYVGESDGKVADSKLRERIAQLEINQRVFGLTQRRTVEESQNAQTPGPQTSIFKYFGAEIRKEQTELNVEMRGTQGIGWEGDTFSRGDLASTRNWLASKAGSIAGGTNEVQLNIIAKRVLGLPD